MEETQRHQLYTLFVLLREKNFLDLYFKILEATQIPSSLSLKRTLKQKTKEAGSLSKSEKSRLEVEQLTVLSSGLSTLKVKKIIQSKKNRIQSLVHL